MIGTLCFWDRKGKSFDERWVLVTKKESKKNLFKRDFSVFETFSSQLLIGAAAFFRDLSSRGIQHESLNRVVFSGSSRSGDAGFRAPSVRCALVAENTPNGLCNTSLHKASGVVPGVGARARPSQEENELELSKCAKIAGAAATDGSTAGTIELLEVHESELSKSARFAGLTATAGLTAGIIGLLEVHESDFSEVARTGESVGIIGLRQVMESDVDCPSLIHESSLARSCADVGAFGAGVSVSGSAAPLLCLLLVLSRMLVLLRMHVERWRVLVIRVVWAR